MLCLWVWTEGGWWSGCRRGRQTRCGEGVPRGGVHPCCHRWEGSSSEHRQVRKGDPQSGWVGILADQLWEAPAVLSWLDFELFLHSYTYFDDEGVFPEIEFVYDLELPPDFQPTIGDGEVQAFYLLPILKVGVLWVQQNQALKVTECVSLLNPFLISGQGVGCLGWLQAQLGDGGAGLPDQTFLPGPGHRCVVSDVSCHSRRLHQLTSSRFSCRSRAALSGAGHWTPPDSGVMQIITSLLSLEGDNPSTWCHHKEHPRLRSSAW